MKRRLFCYCLSAMLLPGIALAVDVRPAMFDIVLATDKTATGQPIELIPQPELRASVYTLAPGKRLPTHKHHHQRFGYVLEGEVALVNMQVEPPQTTLYKKGDFLVEMREQWHYGETVGNQTTKLLVIDVVPPDSGPNLVLQNKVANNPASPATEPQIITKTAAGQPIDMPELAEVHAMTYEIKPYTNFPSHQHPHPRLIYVLSGAFDSIDNSSHEIRRLRAGDFTVDPLHRMHHAENNHGEAADVLVIDIMPPGTDSNTVLGSQAN